MTPHVWVVEMWNEHYDKWKILTAWDSKDKALGYKKLWPTKGCKLRIVKYGRMA